MNLISTCDTYVPCYKVVFFIKLLYVGLLLENVKRIKRMGIINIYSIGQLLNLFDHYYL
jgi:hypothetical protein